MHAGDGDAVLQPHQFGQHLGALDHRNMQPARFGDFGIIIAMAELVTTTSAPAMFSAAWPSKSVRPELPAAAVTAELLQVGAGDPVAEVQQHFGDAAHADAADAHEMNALNFGKHENLILG